MPRLEADSMKRITYVVYVVCLAGFVLAGTQVFRLSAAEKDDDPYAQLELFARVLHRVRNDYVDGDKLTYKELIQGAMKGMLNSLDPHSEYMDLSKFQELKEDTEGAYGGVGLQVQPRDGVLTVIAPMEDTPAFEAGILAGDRIVQIDGKATDRMSQADAVKALRGNPDTKVTVTVSRPSFAQPKDFVLMRGDIRVPTAKDVNNRREFPVGPDKVGYVRLTQFGERSAEELEVGLRKLEKAGMTSLVLDLRGNPGGLLDQAVAICEKFLERGRPIVSTEARSPANEVRRTAGYSGKVRSLPMALLINGGSASASEIVAGCLQDSKRAVIVGEQSFGKGSVQSILPLQDGSALRLTTAKYYTPSHKVIHERGITPDVIVATSTDEEVAVEIRRLPGGATAREDAIRLYPPDQQKVLRDLVEQRRDPPLDRAMDLLKGIALFTRRDPEKSAGEKSAR